jgi:hypothetical protein
MKGAVRQRAQRWVLDVLRPSPAKVSFSLEGDRVFVRQGDAGSEQLIAMTVAQLGRLNKAVSAAAKAIEPEAQSRRSQQLELRTDR